MGPVEGEPLRRWPLLLALGLLCGALAAILVASAAATGGTFVYPQDDPYIHMAIAKHLARDGVWGVNASGFTSSASSLLWPALLALWYRMLGPSAVAPLVLNVALAAALVLWLDRALLRRGASARVRGVALLAVVLATPLPALVHLGMEHTLHALAVAAFAVSASREAARSRTPDWSGLGGAALLAAVATASRYEGLFVVLAACLVLAARRRWAAALAVGAAGLLPVLGYGAISLSKGWYLLPNSVLLKGSSPDVSTLSGALRYATLGYKQMLANPHILWLMIATAAALAWEVRRAARARNPAWSQSIALAVLFVVTASFHLQLSLSGWWMRHDAYVVCLGLVVLAHSPAAETVERGIRTLSGEPRAVRLAVAALAALLVSPYALRAVGSLVKSPLAAKNIYEQQYQMGLFLREFYRGERVAANDIGAITYLGESECVDLTGLANMDFARARRGGGPDQAAMERIARQSGVSIAILYEHWFPGRIPAAWSRVGEWTLPNNVSLGGDTVSFYAVDPGARAGLVERLSRFAGRLPPSVVQRVQPDPLSHGPEASSVAP